MTPCSKLSPRGVTHRSAPALWLAAALLAVSSLAMAEECGPYDSGPASADGIGRFFHGREISHVMGHRGASWLERSTREEEEHLSALIDLLPLTPDAQVADIGVGSGVLAIPIAKRVPQGRVLAVDIQPEMLTRLERRAKAAGVDNIEPVLGTESDPNLPEGTADLIYLVDAWHEFACPREMGQALLKALKPGGLLVLVEYRAEDPEVPIIPLHKMTEAQSRKEMTALGFAFVRNDERLPRQHVLVFQRPSA